MVVLQIVKNFKYKELDVLISKMWILISVILVVAGPLGLIGKYSGRHIEWI